MPVCIQSRALPRRSVRHPALRWRAEAMLRALELQDAEVSVLLCDDELIQQLNQRYRDQDRPTDVLAFAMEEGEQVPVAGQRVLGDVVISVPTAARQAAERGRAIVHEVTFLLAHGLLHLLGYDHATPDEERRMSALTDALLGAVEAARTADSAVEKP